MGLEVSPQDGGRGRRIAAGIVALLVLSVAGGFAWRVFRPDHLPTHAESREARSPDPWAELPEGWTELPPGPALHASAAIVWTGRNLIIWGGNEGDGARHFDDGYAFDTISRTWRQIAPSPLSARSWPAAVWTGSEVLIWGGSDGSWPGEAALGDGAAYDPAQASVEAARKKGSSKKRPA